MFLSLLLFRFNEAFSTPVPLGKIWCSLYFVLWYVYTQWQLHKWTATRESIYSLHDLFFSFSDAINIDAVISIIDNYSNVMNYTNSSWKLNKIFPKSKEKGWTAKRLRIVIKSLVTNRVYGHLFVNTVNKVNSLLAWHVHTCLPWWQRVRILIMIMIFSFSIFFFIIKHILQVAW